MMTIILAGTAVVGIAVVTAVMVGKPKAQIGIDQVVVDFNTIKSALLNYRKEKAGICEKLESLVEYMDEGGLDLSRYSLSGDEKFLIFNASGLQFDVQDLARRIGGSSYTVGTKAYLSFLTINKVSRVKPIARIKTVPAEDIHTTTLIEYDASDSVTEDNDIAEVKWENNRKRFNRPGPQSIKLKVKDKNANWSEWGVHTIVVKEKPGFMRLAGGNDSVFIVANNGHIHGMGLNEFGQLGNGAIVPQQHFKKIQNIDFVHQIVCGEYHTLFKYYDGLVLSVGRNNLGQLGVGNRYDLKIPKEIWGLEGIKQIAAGPAYSAALTFNGKVYVWGDNEHGQLGTDKFTSREMPFQLEDLENIKQISCGNNHMMALCYDGTVFGWGSNDYGQLGVGYKGKNLGIIQTEFKGVQKIVAGKNTSYAIIEGGRVLACGQNNRHQLAIPASREVLFPGEILGVKGITDICVNGNFVVALDGIGEVYTWGQYSNLDDNSYEKPMKLENLKYVKDIAATSTHGYALTDKDEVVRWSTHVNRRDAIQIEMQGDNQ